MRVLTILIAVFIHSVLGERKALENAICLAPDKSILSIYGYIHSHDWVRELDIPRLQSWRISELCIGPLAELHHPQVYTTLNCKCVGTGPDIFLKCEKPDLLQGEGREELQIKALDDLYKELVLLCQSRCLCNPFDLRLDKYDPVVRAARGREAKERPESLDSILKKKVVKYAGSTKKYVLDKCKKNCDGAASCRQNTKDSGCRSSVCRVNQELLTGYCEPLDFSTWWAGSAALSSIAGLGKRTEPDLLEQRICACNSTYISEACCSTDSGLVWEAPGARVGGLLTDSIKT